MDRRAFLTGGLVLISAPAIVRAASLMPVRGLIMDSGLSVRSQTHPEGHGPVPEDINTDVLELVSFTFYVDEHGNLLGGRQVSNSALLRR